MLFIMGPLTTNCTKWLDGSVLQIDGKKLRAKLLTWLNVIIAGYNLRGEGLAQQVLLLF